jgi:hypothetical protein
MDGSMLEGYGCLMLILGAIGAIVAILLCWAAWHFGLSHLRKPWWRQ